MIDSLNHELLRLAREQTDLLSSEFIAPVSPGCNVLVRLGGHWCSMMIVPPSFQGWGVFRPLTRTIAVYCRDATPAERAGYPGRTNLTPADRLSELNIYVNDGSDLTLGVCLPPPRRAVNTSAPRMFRSPPRFS
jgi:hypothetical protein